MKDDLYQLKVRAVLMRESGVSIRKICKELRIDSASLYLWHAIYKAKGNQGLYKAYDHHKSADEKRIIVDDILNNKLSLNGASVKYLVAKSSIKSWLRSYQSHGVEGLRRKNEAGRVMSKKKRIYTEEELDELEILRRRNEWLEAENAMLKKAKALVEAKRAQQCANGQESSKN